MINAKKKKSWQPIHQITPKHNKNRFLTNNKAHRHQDQTITACSHFPRNKLGREGTDPGGRERESERVRNTGYQRRRDAQIC